MKLFRTHLGIIIQTDAATPAYHRVTDLTLNQLLAREDIAHFVRSRIETGRWPAAKEPFTLLAPIEDQEVWGAGVTYMRSREARMEESKSAGGGDFYDRVYTAERPELFFKSIARRVIGPDAKVRIRKDSRWNVPEPELTLLISSTGKITGFTIGNDMSSRDIEGENPLYLPQAKVYDGSCALGPCIYLSGDPLPAETKIQIRIRRATSPTTASEVFTGQTAISQIKRPLESLAQYLFRENSFPHGVFLMTGTGVVPPDSFSLRSGDQIAITIDPIGTLTNTVE